MTAGTDALKDAFRLWRTDGVPATGANEPVKQEIIAGLNRLGVEIGAAQAGLTTVPDLAARDAFFANADNQGKLVYVNDNNGEDDDPDNGVYEYVDGAPRLATGFYQGVASVVQPLVNQAEAAAASASQWRGQRSLWPDPYFRMSYPSGVVSDRPIWGMTGNLNAPQNLATWALVPSPLYDGFALRKTGNTTLTGPRLWLNWLDVEPGDTLTLSAMIAAVAGETSTLRAYFRCYDINAAPTSAQLEMVGAGPLTEAGKVVTNTFTIPADTAFIQVYPVNAASGDVSDLVSLWAVPMAAENAPAVPPPAEDPLLLIGDATAPLERRIASGEVALDYALFDTTRVTGSAETVTLDGTGFGSTIRNLPFSGWGEHYEPAGISFNAIEVVNVTRHPAATALWRSLHVVVRTGANAATTPFAPVVAVGSALVDPEQVPLTNIKVLLRSPVTGEVVTLDDGSFSGGEYFIGVYVRDKDGEPAAMGEINGTMPNTLGINYYLTSGPPIAGAWTVASTSTRQGVRHLLISDPEELAAYRPSAAMVADLANDLGLTAVVPEAVLPPAIYGLQGRETNLYFDNILADDARGYAFDVSAAETISRQLDECWRWTPAAALTTGNLSLSVRRPIDGLELVSGAIAQRSAATGAGSGQTKKVCMIGDSLTQAGIITQALLDNAAGDAMGIDLIGTRGSGANRNEGRGGWRINDYATAGPTYYAFTVSGVAVEPEVNAATYSVGGGTFMVQEVDLTGGAGTIVCSLVSGSAPPSSGTLTKTGSAGGDATIAFTASASQPGNPFWHSGAVNFGEYLSLNALDTPDWVVIHLGTNDVFGSTSDAAVVATAGTELAKLDTIIASIKAADPNVRVALCLIPPPAGEQDAFGIVYQTGQPRWRVKRNYAIWNREIVAKYAGQEGGRVYIAPSGLSVDTVNGYPLTSLEPANARVVIDATYADWSTLVADLAPTHGTVARVTNGAAPGTPAYMVKVGPSGSGSWREAVETDGFVRRQRNGVHPERAYAQIADALWAFFKFFTS